MLFWKRKREKKLSLASKILIGMLLGLFAGFLIKQLPPSVFINQYIVNGAFDIIGKIFIRLLEMLVVPIVFVSLVCGTCSLGGGKKLGRLGIKVIGLFLITTVIAISIALFLAVIFHVGGSTTLTHVATHFTVRHQLNLKQMLLTLVPNNPAAAMSSGNLLQIIVFAILIGVAISMSGKAGKHIAEIFNNLNTILMKLIDIVMWTAPYGVFCLITVAFANLGMDLIKDLSVYIAVIGLTLAIQLFGIYSLLLFFLARLNPLIFFRKMYSVMVFAFGTSSSNATIPLNLEVTENNLGVPLPIASFTIPLGATINMDGTAIMQGVAAVFIAHIYHVSLSFAAYVGIVITATLASIGTAGVPSIGIITLAMVLRQAGLPISGIGLIIGIDRIIDMARTIINISGDTVTACIVAKSEKELDQKVYNEI
ncbi:MAG: dicarboxylate/amino acid:cation symporter [Gammaproteobacteria bacterium]|jgi:Na+/H+-dicarboxylate symporter